MRPHPPSSSSSVPHAFAAGDWRAIRGLMPYLLAFKGRVALALSCLVLAKVANVGVPLLLKEIIDRLAPGKGVLMVPLALVLAYGALRFSTTLFNELRDGIFAKVTQRAIRSIALSVFQHLHALNLRFHLERHTGGLSRDIERGTRGIESLLRFTLFSIFPTLVEMAMVAGILAWKYDIWFALITLVTLVIYIALTVVITEWRTHFRRRMNELDSKANARAIDSLINYETVKYFGNEAWEAQRYDQNLARWEEAAVKSQTSLALLNGIQSLIIGVGAVALMLRATAGVSAGRLTVGDLVLINALLLQLYMPLNFLGVVYREIKQSLADMDRLFRLLTVETEIRDCPDAQPLKVGGGVVRFEAVDFAYDERRAILHHVDFEIPAGHKVAVVGSSGAGKSTLSRLLFRFYDVQQGRILIDGQDIRQVTQQSLRAAIGIVPQDTVLFNDTIYANIAYGQPDAAREDVLRCAQTAHIHAFIESLPEGYETQVGERGLKLSGGEKQRVAIARTLLKAPRILVFDEATSALDSHFEREIQEELSSMARHHTTLVIAHRLSTIIDADQIMVMEAGNILERGTHLELLSRNGRYAELWALQQSEEVQSG
ncbi:putative multidrug export ATP-binding/permease protein [Ferrovum myxofaciens]|uniref:Putative multidrug export ATP-binding/permease protein n=2 Tax=Ferrovum myxofaciens TaxID=416213 RepID=A0A149VYI7_9PROT|nr:ABC transporter ATP-binding protein/permease [Ferrovum myxofaciens]KXW58281.1 putative multidrug export ATP-binding/permease protein [Ferrovum myxofaciens]